MSSAAPHSDPLTVVIIDDTADLRDLLRMALVRGGMSVVGEAGDGVSGIEVVSACRPDLVLLDLSMPVMDGLEALPHLRALVPDARIIVLSGFGANQMSEKAMALGADGYLQKGSALGRMLDHIRDIVAGRPGSPVSHPVHPPLATGVGPVPTGSRLGLAPDQLTSARDDVDEAFALAPTGILQVHAEPPYRVVRANRAAADQAAADLVPGAPLADAEPALAETMSRTRLRGDTEFEASFGSRPVQVTLRHSGTSLLLYLIPITDEVSTLRTAIATAAHEIRGPVTVLSAVAETITDAGPGELEREQKIRLMESVQRQSRMLDSITADLLTVAQIQRGTLQVDVREIDPRAIAEAVLADRYPGDVALEVLDQRQVYADPLRLEQMLGNLLSNAHKYGAPEFVLRIRPDDTAASWVCVEVEDHGPGVPEAFVPLLFREFSRAQGPVATGTGLGLHVVRTLVQAQGGTVDYTPGAAGGALFTLRLPAADATAQTAED